MENRGGGDGEAIFALAEELFSMTTIFIASRGPFDFYWRLDIAGAGGGGSAAEFAREFCVARAWLQRLDHSDEQWRMGT